MVSKLRPARVTLVFATLLIAACADEGGSLDRDLAAGYGEALLTVSGEVPFHEAPHEPTLWKLGERPELLLLGTEEDGNDIGPFYRVKFGRLLDDGGFVVADGGSLELRFYGPDGTLRLRTGGPGSGPREFGSFDMLGEAKDSLYVFDRFNGRVAVLDRGGSRGRLIPVRAPSRALAVFADGQLLLGASEPPILEPGYRRLHRRLSRLALDGSSTDLGRFFSTETYWVDAGDGYIADIGQPFGRTASIVAAGENWYLTPGDRFSVVQFDSVGAPVATYGRSTPPAAVTPGDFEAYIEERRGGRQPGRIERALRSLELPSRLPAYDRLLADTDGSLWARRYSTTASTQPVCWHIYMRNLSFAELCHPRELLVLDVDHDALLGVVQDDDGVERVARYRIFK